jgi:hypothetical protein
VRKPSKILIARGWALVGIGNLGVKVKKGFFDTQDKENRSKNP